MFDALSKHLPTDSVKRAGASNAATSAGTSGLLVQTGVEKGAADDYSHSMVPGGLLVTSSTTRLTSGTSLVMRVEMRSRTS